MLSVVISSFNELENLFFWQSLKMLSYSNLQLELIVVDGGSSDGTWEKLQSYSLTKILLENSNRSKRLKVGVSKAQGEMILLHHSRTLLTEDALSGLYEKCHQRIWGGFRHSFDKKKMGLLFTSFYSNNIRFKLRGVVYLDHGLFFHRELISLKEFPEVPIFEDTLISYKLRKGAKPILLEETIKTSAIRFERNGFLKQALRNQVAKLKFYLQSDFESIDRHYEKNLNLNR